MNNILKLTVLGFVFALLAIGGCKKTNTNTSLLVLNVYPYFGATIVPGQSYTTATGDSISFSRTSFYISNIQLLNTNGTTYYDSGYILVISTNYQNIVAGSVPTGTYKSISFNIGINPATNHIDPATYANGALAAQSPTMHFTSNSDGYIFMAAEGMVDSTNNHLSPNKAFSYHIGTDSLLQTVNLPDHSATPYNAVFNATGGGLLTIYIIADFSQLIQHVNVPANAVTNSTDNVALADTLAAHIPGMFRYQQ